MSAIDKSMQGLLNISSKKANMGTDQDGKKNERGGKLDSTNAIPEYQYFEDDSSSDYDQELSVDTEQYDEQDNESDVTIDNQEILEDDIMINELNKEELVYHERPPLDTTYGFDSARRKKVTFNTSKSTTTTRSHNPVDYFNRISGEDDGQGLMGKPNDTDADNEIEYPIVKHDKKNNEAKRNMLLAILIILIVILGILVFWDNIKIMVYASILRKVIAVDKIIFK